MQRAAEEQHEQYAAAAQQQGKEERLRATLEQKSVTSPATRTVSLQAMSCLSARAFLLSSQSFCSSVSCGKSPMKCR